MMSPQSDDQTTSESEISDSGDGDSGGMVIEMTSFEVDATSDSTMIGEETPQIGGSAGNTD